MTLNVCDLVIVGDLIRIWVEISKTDGNDPENYKSSEKKDLITALDSLTKCKLPDFHYLNMISLPIANLLADKKGAQLKIKNVKRHILDNLYKLNDDLAILLLDKFITDFNPYGQFNIACCNDNLLVA